jgi:NAD(P)H dehydrogenase (quinone)
MIARGLLCACPVNYTGNLAAALAHGAVLGCAQDGRISAAARADYAAAAVAVLTASGTPDPVYELAGDQSFSLAELAAEVSRQASKPMVYKDFATLPLPNCREGDS